MATLTLREAAELAGVSKSTLYRAIVSGRVSATRAEDGVFHLDPAEVHRVFPLKPDKGGSGSASERVEARSVVQHASAFGSDHELLVRVATAEAQLAGVRELLELERRRGEEARANAEEWKRQAERATLALAKPEAERVIPMPAPQPVASGGVNLTASQVKVGDTHHSARKGNPDYLSAGPALVIRLPSWLRLKRGA
jgi:excisionase family DNA binding protein